MSMQIIREQIENIIDESRLKTLKELKAIKFIGIDDEQKIVILIITIGTKGGIAEKNLRRELAKIIKLKLKYRGLKIELEEEKRIINNKTKFIIIAAGKGGVGKTVVATNLAVALARIGKKTALIDADICCSTVAKMMEIKNIQAQITEDAKIIPIKKFGVEIITTDFFTDATKPIVWTSSFIKSMLVHFFFDVKWSPDLEYVIIDMPGGTGEIMTDVSQMIPQANVLLVTTPHPVVNEITIKTAHAYNNLHQNIIGIVENMSHYYLEDGTKASYPCCNHEALYVADELDLEILAHIPIARAKNHLMIYNEDEIAGEIFNDLATIVSLIE